MKTLLAAAALVAALCGTAAYADDAVYQVDGFAGGCEIWTAQGGYGAINLNDVGAAYICSTALTGLAGRSNGLSVVLYTANNTGWGYQTYGGSSITQVYVYNRGP